MKKPNLFKVGLTTIAMLVLSACGSSGGDDAPSSKGATTPPAAKKENPPATTAPSTQKEDYMAAVNQALNDAQAAKAKADAAVKAGDVEAARQALAEAAKALAKANTINNAAFNDKDTNSAAVFDKAKAVESLFKSLSGVVSQAQTMANQNAAQEQANKSIAVTTIPANHGDSNVGYKHVIKSNSDFMIDNVKKKANNESNTGLLMREQNPSEELDNLVVANVDDKIFYLEDTDLRSAEVAPGVNPDKPVNNKVAINNVYLAKVDQQHPSRKERETGKYFEWDTKTTTQGKGKAEALIYNRGQNVYLYKGKDESGLKDSGLTNASILTDVNFETGDFKVVPFTKGSEDQKGTTMVLVGAKTTFANPNNPKDPKDPFAPVKYEEAKAGELTQYAANLPILDSGLQYVQYGRVTSQLSGRELKEFIKGLNTTGLDNTYIAAFGKYGEQGTENHYFARGTDNTTAEQLAGLSKHYGTTKLRYEGHANGYGINNAFSRADKQNNVPTALRGTTQEYLISGNHIRADVDLSTKEVDGNVYNRWGLVHNNRIDENFKVVETPLVGFQGRLADNGNIAGTAQNFTQGNASGILSATIFGPNGEEMGGTIVSDNPAKVQWGLSFGAMNVTQPKTNNVLQPGSSSILTPGTSLSNCSDTQDCINVLKLPTAQ